VFVLPSNLTEHQGSGMFYAGYVAFQIPSNLMLSKVGAKIWLPIITAAWGAAATCCIFISSPASFYALRLALGITEAGAFPAMWHICGQVGVRKHEAPAISASAGFMGKGFTASPGSRSRGVPHCTSRAHLKHRELQKQNTRSSSKISSKM
jgi:MFS family permease